MQIDEKERSLTVIKETLNGKISEMSVLESELGSTKMKLGTVEEELKNFRTEMESKEELLKGQLDAKEQEIIRSKEDSQDKRRIDGRLEGGHDLT